MQKYLDQSFITRIDFNMNGILSDREIKEANIIDPFHDNRLLAQGLTWGISSYGYDCRMGRNFKIFTNVNTTIVDPKDFDKKCFVDIYDADFCVIPPNSFVLASTIECFNMPKDVLAICVGKSTYCRVGINVLCSPLEPGWKGHVTVELSNCSPLPCKVYSGEGVMQVIFFKGNPCEIDYVTKHGKYMNQVGIVLPFVKEKG